MATAGQVFADTEFDAAREKLLEASEAVLALAADHGLNVRDPSLPASHHHIVGGTAAVHDRTNGARAALKQLVSLAQDPSSGIFAKAARASSLQAALEERVALSERVLAVLSQLHAVSDGVLAFDQLLDSGALVDAAVQLDNCCGRLDSAVQHVTSSALPFLLPAPLAPALSGTAGLFSDIAGSVPRISGGGGGGSSQARGYSADDFVRAIEALRCAVDRRAARLRAVVVSCWQRGVVVEGREVRVAKALPLGAAGVAPAELTASAPGRASRSAGGSGEVTLSDVLVAAVQAGVLVDCVAPLAARLRERVLDPVVAGAVDVMVAAAGPREAVLECLPLPPGGLDNAAATAAAAPAPLAVAVGRVRAAVEFLRLHAFAPVAGGSATPEATADALSLAFALLGSCVWYGPHLVSVCASSAAAIDAVSLAAAVASEPPPPVLMLGTPPGGAAALRLPPASAALWGHDAVSIAPSGLPVPHALGPGDAATSLLHEQPPRLRAPRLADWPRAHAPPATPERGSGASQQQLHLAWAWGQLEGSLRVGLSRLLTPGGGAPDSAWGLLHALLRLCASGVPGGPPDSGSDSAGGPGSVGESGASPEGAAAASAEAALAAMAGDGGSGALAAFRRDVLRPAAELEAWLHERGFVASAEEGLQSLAAADASHHSHHRAPGAPSPPPAPAAAGAGLLRPLAAALADAEELYAYRLRVAVLAAARAACLGDYHNSSVVRGVDENAGINSAMAALLRPSAEVAEAAPAPLAGSIGETLLGWVTGSEVPPPTVGGAPASAPRDLDAPDFESLLFRLPTCQVSAVALQLVRLAQAAMAAAEAAAAAHSSGELSLHTAWVLFRSAKDALGLLPAVVPLRCGPVIASSPRLAMLLHNDCLFLAHHAVLLGWRYANILVPSFEGGAADAGAPVPVTFVDLLPMLRAMAQRALLGQVRKARASVSSAFTDAAGGWTLARVAEDALAVGGDDDDASSAAWAVALEGAAKAQVRHLLGVAEAWGSVLPRTVFFRAVGAIAAPALRATTAVALSARHLAGAGLHVLTIVLNTQMRGVVSALERWGVDDATPGNGSDGASLPDRFVPGWARATAVAEVLDAPLATIRMRVEARAFRGALSHAEVARLLHALFAASPARSALLRLLEQQAAADAAAPAPESSLATAGQVAGRPRAPPVRPASVIAAQK